MNLDEVLTVRALPRRPGPEGVDPKPRIVTGEALDDLLDGANLGSPEQADAEGAPRELRLDGRLLEKFGFTKGSQECTHKQKQLAGVETCCRC